MAGAMAGCATLPAPGARPTVAAASAYATQKSFTAPPAPWPSDRWWRNYKDPQLTALIEEGLANAPDMRVAADRFARAKALARETESGELPHLSANGQVGGTKQSYRYIFPAFATPRGWKDYSQATLDLSWDVDFWGRTRAAARAARQDAAAAAAEAADTRLVLSTGIASAYADLARLHAELDAARDAVEVRRRTAALIGGRYAKGLENDGAVERARSGQDSAEADVAELGEEIDLTRSQIAVLIGAGPDRGLAITRPAPGAIRAFGLPANLPLELVGRRPDVIAARDRALAAASRIKASKAAFYPDINLSAQVGLQALGVGNLVRPGADYGTAGPAVSLPILDGGSLAGQYRAAEADYRIAVAQYDGALDEALREVADAAVSERALATRLERTREAERSAEAAWRVAGNRYRGGLATYLDVLTAEDALITARRAVAALETRAFALDISLTRALGGGFQS
jgi:NodT family efflux transporter outer membrane factor (OMF) lipoprotein